MRDDDRLDTHFDRLLELVEGEEARRELVRNRDAVLAIIGDAFAEGVSLGANAGSNGASTSVIG
jgi:hypothetical protein